MRPLAAALLCLVLPAIQATLHAEQAAQVQTAKRVYITSRVDDSAIVLDGQPVDPRALRVDSPALDADRMGLALIRKLSTTLT